MEKYFLRVTVLAGFFFMLILSFPAVAVSQLYFPPADTKAEKSSPKRSLNINFLTIDEILKAQKKLGSDIYVQISNTSQGQPSEVQAVVLGNTMYVTWIGNGTTVFLAKVQGKGAVLNSPVVLSPKAISLNNTVNASNLQISVEHNLVAITWLAVKADTGLSTVDGSLSRDGVNFHSFQISTNVYNASAPFQPNAHFVIYIVHDDPNDDKNPCGPPGPPRPPLDRYALLDNNTSTTTVTIPDLLDSSSSNNATTTSNSGQQISEAISLPGRPPDIVCLYRWA